jgi:hypothetical protein
MRRVVQVCLLAAGVATFAACGGGGSTQGQQDSGPGQHDGPVQTDGGVQQDGPAQTDGPVQTDGPAQTDGPLQSDAGAKGHAGSGAVVGAVKAQSANYKLVGSVTSGRGTANSTSYKYRGGVVGATQKP